MVTKNIKKILLNKNGNKFVVDTENIVRSVNGVNADENGNVSITSVANATNATNADIATRLKGYDNHNSIYLGWDGNNLTMNVDNVDSTKGVVITHKNISSQSVKHATSADSATNATNADNATNLGGYPATDYIRSVNGVKASENGNVTIPLPFVKTVNSTAPDSNGNVVLDLSSSGGGVGLPDLSAGVAISNLNGEYHYSATKIYTLPSNGWVTGNIIINYASSGSPSVYLNNSLLQDIYVESTKYYMFSIPLKSGTQIKLQIQNPNPSNAPRVSSTLRFYPFLR